MDVGPNIEEVETPKILQKAMSIVRSAEREILATMDLTEEIKAPLPTEYFSLLEEKMGMGVQVTRLAFGSLDEFKLLLERLKVKSANYKCILAASKDYKRMLLIDGKHLLFARESKK